LITAKGSIKQVKPLRGHQKRREIRIIWKLMRMIQANDLQKNKKKRVFLIVLGIWRRKKKVERKGQEEDVERKRKGQEERNIKRKGQRKREEEKREPVEENLSK
jgi:hypothetical protein